jgi:hypothetical protein
LAAKLSKSVMFAETSAVGRSPAWRKVLAARSEQTYRTVRAWGRAAHAKIPQAAQPVPPLQLLTRDHPAGGDDVRPLSSEHCAPLSDVERLCRHTRKQPFGGTPPPVILGTPLALIATSTDIDREFYAYYRPRAASIGALTGFASTSHAQLKLGGSFANLSWIAPRPILFVTGDRAFPPV